MTPAPHLLHQALSLPYSVGAHRLLREIVSQVHGIEMPATDPPVRHGPVRQVQGVRRATLPRAPERRNMLLQALQVGPITQDTAPYDWHVLISDIGVLRKQGYRVLNTGGRRAALYALAAPNR